MKDSIIQKIVTLVTTLTLLVAPWTVRSEGYDHYFLSLTNHHALTLPSNVISDRNVRCLALNIFYEARGEPILGQLAVANVTMNRFYRSDKSICQIVYSPGQFEWTSRRLREPAGDAWKQAYAIAWLVLNEPELVRDVTNNALYFHSNRRTPTSFRKHEHTITIGGHRFYKERQYEEVARSLN